MQEQSLDKRALAAMVAGIFEDGGAIATFRAKGQFARILNITVEKLHASISQ